MKNPPSPPMDPQTEIERPFTQRNFNETETPLYYWSDISEVVPHPGQTDALGNYLAPNPIEGVIQFWRNLRFPRKGAQSIVD